MRSRTPLTVADRATRVVASRARPHIAWLAAAGLALVALLALLHVPWPFDDDQGLFTFGARAIAHGARLYVDFWDLKQPGIYWYFVVAGSLFGFDNIGIHCFDLLWMMALAVVLLRIGMRWFSIPLLAASTPLICLGPFYAKADPIHLSQVEIVVVLPIALVFWLLMDASPWQRRDAWRFAVAGVLTVFVAMFKIVLGPIPAALIALVLLHSWLAGRKRLHDILLHGALPAAAGGAVATAIAIAYLWHRGILTQTLWVAFTYPPLALAEYDWQPLAVLESSAAWFWSALRFLMPFALIGAWREIVVRRSRPGWLALVWLLVGALVLVAQVLSWWQYHFNLFFVPLGLLTVAGVQEISERAARRGRGRWVPLAACCVILALSVSVSIAHKLQRYWFSGPSPFQDPMAFMIRVEPRMQAIAEATAFLARLDARPGRIANLGDPRISLYSGRPVILAVNGSGYMLAAQWAQAAELLDKERPVYIYLGNDTRYIWSHGTDAIERLVAAHYVLVLRDVRRGEWYELHDGAPAAAAR